MEIKNYKNGDELEIINLFNDAFKREFNINCWNWNYNNNYFKNKYIKLMWDEKKLVGHYALIPIILIINGSQVNTGLSMTTMTSSAYKKKGIFKNLASRLYSETYNKINLIWGFPNNNSLHGFTKYLGWKHISDIYIYRCKTYGTVDINNINIKNVLFFDEKFDDLFEGVKNKYNVIIQRTSEYLTWRYQDHSENKYYCIVYEYKEKYLGYCIYKIYDDNNTKYCDIVDVISVNEEIFRKMMQYIINKMNSENIHYINIWMNNKEYINTCENVGFYKTNIFTHFGVKINCDYLNEDMYDFSSWYITMGDSDVF